MIQIGFKQCESDLCVNVKKQNEILIYVLLYIDDILVFCSDMKIINDVKQLLSKEFEITDMGKAGTLLGMCIEQKYLEKVLQKFNTHIANQKQHQWKRVCI